MNLRKPHIYPGSFMTLVAFVAVCGALVARASFAAGGAWNALGIAMLIGEALIAYGMFIEPRRLTVVRYREALHRHPSAWIRIAFLSDLHAGGGYAPDWWERVALETQALAPDLIVLGGDFVVESADAVDDLAPLSRLHAPLGRFFVLGNHDYLDRPQDVRAAARRFGYEDLTHRTVRLKHEGREVDIRGLDDHWYGTIKPFSRPSPAVPFVLISHEPDALMDLRAGDADLVLSGHTHGGQIRFPLIGPLWVPTRLGRAFDHGRKTLHGVTGIISNGVGQTQGHPRLFSPPQIAVIEIGI